MESSGSGINLTVTEDTEKTDVEYMNKVVVTREKMEEIFSMYNNALEIIDFKCDIGTKFGDNYMSLMYSVKVNVKNKENGSTSTIPMMLKAYPQNESRRQYLNHGKFFLKESKMYSEVLPKLTAFTSFSSYPEVFHTCSTESDKDYIALRDLKPNGYKMVNRIEGFDYNHSAFVIKELAKFHALSFVKYKGDSTALYKDFPYLKETFWEAPDIIPLLHRQFVDNTFTGVLKVLETAQLVEEKARVHTVLDNIYEKMYKLTSAPEKFPSVVNHGDCWSNNILFKYDSEGTPVDLKFVDFQLSKISSRVLDLLYMCFTSMSIPLMNEKMTEFMQIYYNAFNNHAILLGAKAPLTFQGQELTWDFFLEEWNHFRMYGPTMALFLLPVIAANPEHAPDMEKITQEDIDSPPKETDCSVGVWQSERMREKLINVAKNHLPAQ